jgi:hypothetical protein
MVADGPAASAWLPVLAYASGVAPQVWRAFTSPVS